MKVLYNNISPGNAVPSRPENLSSQVAGDSVRLIWTPVTDPETPANSLTYNVMLYSDAGDTIFASSSHPDGRRKTTKPGNAGLNTFLSVRNLPDGIYHWTVQAIDHQFAGSEFAVTDSFTICEEFQNDSLSLSPGEDPGTGAIIYFSCISGNELTGWAWDFGNGDSSSDESPSTVYSAPGIFDVTLTVSDPIGCMKTITQTVEITEEIPIHIMNLITPNHDDKNDGLYVENIERYPDNEVRLLDLWGNELFMAQGYMNDWESLYTGPALPNGNYICTVKIKKFDASCTETITVLR
jgi:gliding motility-associated-like protein